MSDIKTIIINGNHNNRLKCFFYKFNKDSKNFSNCAIIRCYRDENSNVKFSMIYSGDYIDSSCWTLDEFNKSFDNINIKINLPDNTEILLIRHGKGIHNHNALLERIYYYSISDQNVIDPSLDKTGVSQAVSAGKFLELFFNKNYNKPDIYFTASHLIRTQQTVGLIMQELKIKKTIHISPCTHEILYISKNDCECLDLGNKFIPANTPNCDINNMCESLNKFCHTDCYNTNSIPLNWDYYKLFYNSKEKCCNNNMIEQIIRTIRLAENPNLHLVNL